MNNKLEIKSPLDNISVIISRGNKEISKGHIDKCIEYYFKGLDLAIEANNFEKAEEIYHLIITI